MTITNKSFTVTLVSDSSQFLCKSRLKLPLSSHDIHFLQIFIIMGRMKESAEVI